MLHLGSCFYSFVLLYNSVGGKHVLFSLVKYAFIKSTFGLIVLILLITSFLLVAFLCLWKSLSLWEGARGSGWDGSLTWLQEGVSFQSYTV